MSRLRLYIMAVSAALALSGCASFTGPAGAPACDGGSRRPLNRSMWAWETAQPVTTVEASPALPAAMGTVPLAPAAPLERRGALDPTERSASTTAPTAERSTRFDIAASTRACTGEPRHG